MARLGNRLAALGLSGLVSLLVAAAVLAWWTGRPREGTLDVRQVDRSTFRALAARVSAAAAHSRDPLRRVPLDEPTVREIMSLRGETVVYDPVCYFRYAPDLDLSFRWPEHPAGRVPLVTNSLGIRRDGEIASSPPDLRILVTGDSHTAGLCANSESLAGQLERLLAPARPGRSVEVLNAAVGGYGFYHYVGVLERYLALGIRPEVFVVVVYGGNDFGSVGLWYLFHGTQGLLRDPARAQLLNSHVPDYKHALGQVLFDADLFGRATPAELDTVLRMARVASGEIQRQCERERIALLVAYLPPPTEVPAQAPMKEIRDAARDCGLSQRDIAAMRRISDRYLADLERMGITAIDLRPVFEERTELLFWEKDLHLNVTGHRVAAETLLPHVEAWWESRGRRAEGDGR